MTEDANIPDSNIQDSNIQDNNIQDPSIPEAGGQPEFNLGKEQETETIKSQKVVAEYIKECDAKISEIKEIHEHLSPDRQESVNNFIKSVEESSTMTYEDRRNALSFLSCKIFFGLNDVKIPEHLKGRIERVMKERSYSPKIREDLDILSSHIPVIKNAFKEGIDRQKTAEDFSYTGVTQNNSYQSLLNAYCKGTITLAEFEKQSGNEKCQREKQELLKFAKEKQNLTPAKKVQGLDKYSGLGGSIGA
jgi:hypothetical protein